MARVRSLALCVYYGNKMFPVRRKSFNCYKLAFGKRPKALSVHYGNKMFPFVVLVSDMEWGRVRVLHGILAETTSLTLIQLLI